MKEEKRLFNSFSDFIAGWWECSPEVQAAELKNFSALERNNFACTEYIAADSYPVSKFLRSNMKIVLRVAGKVYYPIVGWDPDVMPATSEGEQAKVPPLRKWLNRLPKRKLHNPREDRTYILYG